MHQYRVQFVVHGLGVLSEIITAQGTFEARRNLESRYPSGKITIIGITQIS